MFLPLVSILLHFGEIQRYTDIILLSSNPQALQMVRASLISRFAQFAFIKVHESDRDEILHSLNFKSSPNLFCMLVNDTSEAVGLAETTWFLNGISELCGIHDGVQNLSTKASSTHREYLWHNSICLCIIWPRSPKSDAEMNQEVMWKLLRNIVPKEYQIDSCVYFWFLDSGLIFEAYHFKNNLIVRQIGLQKGQTGGSSVERRKNFDMATVTAGHVEVLVKSNLAGSSMLYLKGWGITSSNGKNTLSLSNTKTYQCLAYMQDFLNFTVIVVSNPEWSAMSEKVKSGKVDIGISATAMMPSLTKDLRFLSTPTYTEQLNAYFSLSDDSNSDATFLHVKPFSYGTWLVMFLVLALLFLVHYGMSRELNNSCWYVLACLTMQGYSVGVNNSIRIVTFVGAVLFVILYALYSGELISSLSTKTEKSYSVHALIEMGFTFGIKNDSYLRAAKAYGDFGEDSLAAKIFSKLHKKMGKPGIDEAINYIFEHGKYGFISEENVFESLVRIRKRDENDTLCNSFRDVPIPEYTVQQTPIVRRDSQFVDHFNLARLRMMETGIWNLHWRRQDRNTLHLKPHCRETQTTSFEINDVLLPLFIITCGFVASILIFIFELSFRFDNDKLQYIY